GHGEPPAVAVRGRRDHPGRGQLPCRGERPDRVRAERGRPAETASAPWAARCASSPSAQAAPSGARMSSAVVVGSGPNGLAAAVALARAGLDVTVLEAQDTIGGGTRTEQLTVPGVLHDVCSATHPLAIGSPFLQTLDLGRHGLEWCWPEID